MSFKIGFEKVACTSHGIKMAFGFSAWKPSSLDPCWSKTKQKNVFKTKPRITVDCDYGREKIMSFGGSWQWYQAWFRPRQSVWSKERANADPRSDGPCFFSAFLFFLWNPGTSGSGKSTLVDAFHQRIVVPSSLDFCHEEYDDKISEAPFSAITDLLNGLFSTVLSDSTRDWKEVIHNELGRSYC